jgi:hypothetical protein
MIALKGESAMKRFLVGILLTGVVALPAFAALKRGDKAPDFAAKASLAGKEFDFSLKAALKKGPVVVYFILPRSPAAVTSKRTPLPRTRKSSMP